MTPLLSHVRTNSASVPLDLAYFFARQGPQTQSWSLSLTHDCIIPLQHGRRLLLPAGKWRKSGDENPPTLLITEAVRKSDLLLGDLAGTSASRVLHLDAVFHWQVQGAVLLAPLELHAERTLGKEKLLFSRQIATTRPVGSPETHDWQPIVDHLRQDTPEGSKWLIPGPGWHALGHQYAYPIPRKTPVAAMLTVRSSLPQATFKAAFAVFQNFRGVARLHEQGKDKFGAFYLPLDEPAQLVVCGYSRGRWLLGTKFVSTLANTVEKVVVESFSEVDFIKALRATLDG